MVGSCGTAAFRGEPVEVTDIATDPLWEDYQAPRAAARVCAPAGRAPSRAPTGASSAPSHSITRARAARTSLERQVVATCVNLCTIALEHEETRSRAYEQAFTDPLTRLANRARFQQRVSETMAIVAETGQRIAVQYIGLDRFQAVNEMLGYATGDELLRVVAARLQSVVKDHDAVARIGGDEFAVIQVGDFRTRTSPHARGRSSISSASRSWPAVSGWSSAPASASPSGPTTAILPTS